VEYAINYAISIRHYSAHPETPFRADGTELSGHCIPNIPAAAGFMPVLQLALNYPENYPFV